MRIAKKTIAILLLSCSFMPAQAEEQCGRWVECPETTGLSASQYKSYIYRNSRDIEPWAPSSTRKASSKETLLRPASTTATPGVTAGAEQVKQAQTIAQGGSAELLPGDVSFHEMDVGQMILEAAPELTPDQIAEGIRAAEMYLKSVGYNGGTSDKASLNFPGLENDTGRESGMDGVSFTNEY